MKKLILIGFSVLLSQFAFGARRVQCHSVPIRPDSGYMLRFNRYMTRVVVEEQTFRGPERIATLDCEMTGSTNPRRPNRTVVQCYEPRLRDAGYAVEYRMNMRTRRQSAVLYEINFRGSLVVSNMACN